jgi:hypothetical protein
LVSGNYGFFNLLTLVLCLPLFDDAFWPARVQKLLARRPPAAEIIPLGRRKQIAGWARGLVAGAVIFIGVIQIDEAWRNRTRAEPPPPPGALAQFLDELSGRAQQLGLVNSYGLFRVMTTERPELTIEGSDDGATWRPYEFYWKPGDPMRPPSFATPHMPRLDWQMWFAALDIYYGHQVPGWLPALLAQLQQGNPQVLALFEHNPFPQAPPKLLRLRLDLYRFTTPAEHAKTGAWWSITPHPEFTMTWSPR